MNEELKTLALNDMKETKAAMNHLLNKKVEKSLVMVRFRSHTLFTPE